MKEVEKFLQQLNSWDGAQDIQKTLNEIIEYMPRNKQRRRKRSSELEDY